MKKLHLVAAAAIVLISLFCNHLYDCHVEQKELYNQTYYELYSSFYKNREQYRMFLMVNPRTDQTSVVSEIFTESFICETTVKMRNTGLGEYPIKVYLLNPSDELPYGWKKSELNISVNFDQSIFYRNTYCTVTIPPGASTMQECIFDDYTKNKER